VSGENKGDVGKKLKRCLSVEDRDIKEMETRIKCIIKLNALV